MTAIPEAATRRFGQLRQMSMIAVATSDGIKSEVDHWLGEVRRLSRALSDLRNRFGDVEVGPGGEAYINVQRRTTSNQPGHRVVSYDVNSERRPDLDCDRRISPYLLAISPRDLGEESWADRCSPSPARSRR